MLWLLLLFLGCRAAAAASGPTIGPVTCPSGGDVVDVPANSDLSLAFIGSGKTYNIPAGTYTMSSTIIPITGTTCFVGVGSGSVTITYTGGQHFWPSNGANGEPSFGLKGVKLVGGAGSAAGRSGGVQAYQARAIGIEDVVFDHCQVMLLCLQLTAAVWALIAGRLLVGLGIGAPAIVVPAYLAEIAPAKHRGMVVQMYEVMLTLGMLAAVLVNLGLSTAAGGAAWRWMVGLPAIPGAFLLASLVSLPESPRWLVMRGQLDAALTTLHTIIASSSKGGAGGRGSSRRSRARQRAAMQQAVAAAGGLPVGSVAAEDAAWLNAAPEAGRPRSAAHKALEAAEDELLLLWSSVQKEQAAGMELRQSAAGGRQSADGLAGIIIPPTAAAVAGDRAAAAGGGSPRRRFAVQAAPAAAFSLDEEEGGLHPHGLNGTQHQQHQQQQSPQPHLQQQDDQRPPDSCNGDASAEPDRLVSKGAQHNSSSAGGGGVSSSGGAGTTRLKGLQQKLHLGGRGSTPGAEGEGDGQQQLLLDSSAISSSSQPLPPQGNHHQQQPQQQQGPQPRPQDRRVEPGQESNVFASLWAMLVDIQAVARGPERAAFGIACALAVFDQAMASTAIINYAPEVLANRMGVQDPSLAIMYPAAIALAKVVGTLIAAVTVDKYGRKPLLVWGVVGCAVFLCLTGVSLAVGSVALYLAALCLFIFSFSLSWAGLYWVVVSEIFSMGAKSPATSAATSLLFLTGAVVNFLYLSLIQWVGGFAFAMFGLIAALSAVYVWRRVPETKGRTLAEIQALLAPGGAASGVSGPRPGGLLLQPAPAGPPAAAIAASHAAALVAGHPCWEGGCTAMSRTALTLSHAAGAG